MHFPYFGECPLSSTVYYWEKDNFATPHRIRSKVRSPVSTPDRDEVGTALGRAAEGIDLSFRCGPLGFRSDGDQRDSIYR